MRQLNLFKEKIQREFGGSLLLGKRKAARPIDTKKSIHLVLKAKNSFALLRNKKTVEETLRKYAQKFGLTIYALGVQADHIHLEIKVPSRELYVRWVRAITSVLVSKIKGLKWKLRPYTKILSWGKQFQKVKRYIFTNQKEGEFLAQAIATADDYDKELERIKAQLSRQFGPLIELSC